MAENGGSWNLQRKDGIYGVLMLATVGVAHVVDKPEPPKPDPAVPVLVEKVGALERNVGQLQDPGGPVLRQVVQQARNHEERIHDLENSIRAGVTREAIEDLKQRLVDAKADDKEMRAQLDALRTALDTQRAAMDALRAQIERAASARLVGPSR